jgi:hypothetical protein
MISRINFYLINTPNPAQAFLSLISIKIKLKANSRQPIANRKALWDASPKGIILASLKIIARTKAMAARAIKRLAKVFIQKPPLYWLMVDSR